MGKNILDRLSIQFDISCGVIVVQPANDNACLKCSSSGSCILVLAVECCFLTCGSSTCSVVIDGTLLGER